jgi:hypothetical protein
MKLPAASVAAALFLAGLASAEAADVDAYVTGARVGVSTRVVTRHVGRRAGERDGAAIFSGKVMSRSYAYPRYSPGLLPTSAAVAYRYAYAPDYGFAYRLVPPVAAGATCVADPELVYNTRGIFDGYGTAVRCY